MKKRVLIIGMILPLLLELAVLLWFCFSHTEKLQDTVVVNEVVQDAQNHWGNMEQFQNKTVLDFVVLDLEGTVLYKTKENLSESIHAAIQHKDTMLDLIHHGTLVGKLIVYNHSADLMQAEKQTVIFVMIGAMVLQCFVNIGYFLYVQRTVLKPFQKLRGFAQRVANGNLDIPLEMDRQNLFGAFTESFDIMRSELKKARIAEANANESKKELVAKLSHDIRTPVASIKAASEVGAALAADEKNRTNYEQIIHKADQINILVTNLFSATLEELKELAVMPTDMKSTELYTLLENADYLHKAEIPSVPDCLLFADVLRLQQVFDNVFANSYKYAGTDMFLSIYHETAEDASRYLVVCIEDHGGGVEEAELPLLKEKFKRGRNAKQIEGAGLGLYIADFCMKKMRGRLDVENGVHGLCVKVKIALSTQN